MHSPVLGLRVASVIFGLVALGHLLRFFMTFQIMLGSHPVPVWLSGVAVVVAGVLSIWLWRLSCPVSAPATPAQGDSAHPVSPGTPAAHA